MAQKKVARKPSGKRARISPRKDARSHTVKLIGIDVEDLAIALRFRGVYRWEIAEKRWKGMMPKLKRIYLQKATRAILLLQSRSIPSSG